MTVSAESEESPVPHKADERSSWIKPTAITVGKHITTLTLELTNHGLLVIRKQQPVLDDE
jgi:hypothetical protein